MLREIKDFVRFAGPLFFFFVGLFFVGIFYSILPLERAECEGFGRESGYQVEFAHLSPGSYECLIKLPSGHWIPAEHLRSDSQ